MSRQDVERRAVLVFVLIVGMFGFLFFFALADLAGGTTVGAVVAYGALFLITAGIMAAVRRLTSSRWWWLALLATPAGLYALLELVVRLFELLRNT